MRPTTFRSRGGTRDRTAVSEPLTTRRHRSRTSSFLRAWRDENSRSSCPSTTRTPIRATRALKWRSSNGSTQSLAVHGLLLGHKERHPHLWVPGAGSFVTGSFDSAHDVGNFTPNDEINRADRTWEWNGKVMGAYIFPADVQVSANFEHRSGDVFARQVRFTGGRRFRRSC